MSTENKENTVTITRVDSSSEESTRSRSTMDKMKSRFQFSSWSRPTIPKPEFRKPEFHRPEFHKPDLSKENVRSEFYHTGRTLKKFMKFIGPGFMVAVAYIDPGNYATDVSAGAQTQFKLLFMVLMSNLIAIFFQTQCIKLGSVTGLTLAEKCRKHMPFWLNCLYYLFAEVAIIATDVAEVIGTAIAINLLTGFHLIGCVGLTILDVVFVIIFYRPKGESMSLRAFEYFVAALVLVVVVSFCINLSTIHNTTTGQVLDGYLPSNALFNGNGLSLAAGILGATVMPHSLFLGSGFVQSRLRKFDLDAGRQIPTEEKYQPSMDAIKSCMKYSICELVFQLFTFALFVNSAILIVGAAALFGTPGADQADLFDIHDILSSNVAPIAGTAFALALLMSGLSAGIVCTVASQISTEGFMEWHMPTWVMRLITRSISITPSLIIASKEGRVGLGNALNGSQVVLSLLLPVISLPLVYYTCRKRFMTVSAERINESKQGTKLEGDAPVTEDVDMSAGWFSATVSWILWVIVAVMNAALLIMFAMGDD